MKKLFLASVALVALNAGGSALAADMPVKARPLPPPPVWSWTGLYVGAHIGWAHTDSSAQLSGDSNIGQRLIDATPPFEDGPFIPSSLNPDVAGFIGGIQAGYNWQVSGGIVVGLEVDVTHSAADGTDARTLPAGPALTTSLESELKWFSTVRGRLGFLPVAGLLVYATGGVAFGEVEQSLTAGFGSFGVIFSGPTGGVTCPASIACFAGSSSKTSVGWTAGGGFELALTNSLSLKGEYLYVDLGEAGVTAVPTQPTPVQGAFLRAETETKLHVVRAGVNFKF